MYAGVQKRKNHHTPSVMNLPKTTAQVCGYLKHCQERNALFILWLSAVVAFVSLLIVFVLLDICQLSCVHVSDFHRGFLYMNIQQSHPDEAQGADHDESHLPAVANAHAPEAAAKVGCQRGEQRADRSAGIEDRSGRRRGPSLGSTRRSP